MEFDDQLTNALSAEEEGNVFFRDKQYDLAVESYARAISLCPGNDENLVIHFTFF